MYPTAEDKMEALATVQTLLSFGFKNAISYGDGLDLYGWMREHKEELQKEEIEITSGASKVCIITSNKNWVIKVGFQRATMKRWREGGIADYCELEAEIYEKAVRENCADHLAVTVFCGELDGIKVYLQERADTCEDMFEEMMYEYVSNGYSRSRYTGSEYYDNIAAEVDDCESEMCIYAVLGESVESSALVDFAYRNNINDLHPLNWGIAQDDRIVLIDFSGF